MRVVKDSTNNLFHLPSDRAKGNGVDDGRRLHARYRAKAVFESDRSAPDRRIESVSFGAASWPPCESDFE